MTATSIDETANGIYRISTPLPPDAIPGGFAFNQYLVVDEEPLLFHTGPRGMFEATREAIEHVMPVSRLKYVAFSHYESDECGALNEFLAVAPDATPVCGRVNAMINGDWVGARFSGTQDWGGSPEEVSVGKKPSTRGARAATERRRSRSRVAATTADRGRWSSKRKVEVVLRLLKGETLDAVSRGLSVSTQRLSQWRTDFLGGGQSALKTREPDQREEEVRDLRAKVGELTMDNELLYQKIERMEADLPPAPWRRKR